MQTQKKSIIVSEEVIQSFNKQTQFSKPYFVNYKYGLDNQLNFIHLDNTQITWIDTIIHTLENILSNGFRYISLEHSIYKYNTYTDAEYYYHDSLNNVAYISKEKNQIKNLLDSFTLTGNSEFNSIDNIKEGVSFTVCSTESIINQLRNKTLLVDVKDITTYLKDFFDRVLGGIEIS